MKIAVISSTVFSCPLSRYGGLEQVAWQCAEGLASLGHDATLFAPEGSRTERARLRSFGPIGISEHEAYSGYWQELPSYDVVVDHSWNKWAYVLKAEGKLPAPVLGVLHAPVRTMYQSLPPVERPSFVCLSEDQAAHFTALFERPCRVAYNAVDGSFYRPMEGVRRTDRFLFLARFSSIKGPLLAIEACKKAGAKLDLVGDTLFTNEPDYFERCKKACDGEQIRTIGPASRGECVRRFSEAFCFVHSARDFREPFGLAPVEAQACGCPVIAFDRGALRETVRDGRTGWLVDTEQELAERIKLVKKTGIPEQMREQCAVWANETFSLGRFATRYEQLCKEALETGGW